MARWARSPHDAALVLVATARELGLDPERLTARQALQAWTTAAQVPFRVPPVADADGLGYGFEARDGIFCLDLVRRFALRDGGRSQVACRVRVPLTLGLAVLGSHVEWCHDPATSPERLAWTQALGERPEWSELDRAGVAEVVIDSMLEPAPAN